jgi:hypothetical protein
MSPPEKPLSALTRIVWWVVVVNALGGAFALIQFPTQSEILFFWKITPPINVALFGGAYLVASLAVLQGVVNGRWESQRYLIPMILGFSLLLLIASFLHVDKFVAGYKLYYWLAVYIVAPIAAIIFYVQHERGGANWDVIGERVSPAARWAAIISGGLLGLFVAFSFIWPEAVAALYLWPISPLMVRVFAAWSAAMAAGLLWFIRERDWHRLRWIPTWLLLIGISFAVLTVIHRGDVKPESADRLWLLYLGLVGFSLLGFAIHGLQRLKR